MKLAIITSRYPSENNPYQHMFVHTRAKFFVENGIDVEIFVPKNQTKTYFYEGIKVNEVKKTILKTEILKFDLIYLHLLNTYPIISTGGYSIYNYIKKNKIPYLIYFHGNEVYKYERYKSDYNYGLKETIKWIYKDFWSINKMRNFVKSTKEYGQLFFPSKWLLHEAQNNFNLQLSNSKIIPNGINTSLFEFKTKDILKQHKIITIRSLGYKVYNIKMTIDILCHLPENYSLDIYGTGKYKAEYESYIKQKKLENRVKIIEKFMPPLAMKELFSNYGIFISTTDVDSQGVTIQEAMSCGLLGVVNRNSCKDEFYTNKVNAIIGDSAQEIARDISEIIDKTQTFDTIVNNANKWLLKNLSNNIVTKNELDAILDFNSKNKNEN